MNPSRLKMCLFFLAIFLILQLTRQKTVDIDTRQLHNVLAAFIARGQLVIELFPPLSLILAAQLLRVNISWVAVGSRLLIASALVYSLPLQPATQHIRSYFLCAIALALIYFLLKSRGSPALDPFTAASNPGSCIQVLVVMNILTIKSRRRVWASGIFGVSEMLLIIGCCIGNNPIDSATSYLLLLEIRITSACRIHSGLLYSKVSQVTR